MMHAMCLRAGHGSEHGVRAWHDGRQQPSEGSDQTEETLEFFIAVQDTTVLAEGRPW